MTDLSPRKKSNWCLNNRSKKIIETYVYVMEKNEEVSDVVFETKKQQKHKAIAAQDNKLIAQSVS